MNKHSARSSICWLMAYHLMMVHDRHHAIGMQRHVTVHPILQHLNGLAAGVAHVVLLGQAGPQLKTPQVACNTGTAGGPHIMT